MQVMVLMFGIILIFFPKILIHTLKIILEYETSPFVIIVTNMAIKCHVC